MAGNKTTINKRDLRGGNDTSEANIINGAPDRLRKNEKWSLFLSITAIVISLLGAGWSELKDARRRSTEQRQTVVLSYRLGHELSASAIQREVCDRAKIPTPSGMTSVTLVSIQSLIDQMALNFSIKDLEDPEDMNAISEYIYARIDETRGGDAASAFRLGLCLGCVYAFASAPADEASIIIPDFVKAANKRLKNFGIKEQMTIPRPYEKKEMMKELTRVDVAFRARWR